MKSKPEVNQSLEPTAAKDNLISLQAGAFLIWRARLLRSIPKPEQYLLSMRSLALLPGIWCPQTESIEEMTNVINLSFPCATSGNLINHDAGSYSGMPSGYVAMRDGIYLSVETAEGGVEERRLCSPLRVLALVRDVAGTDWGRLVEVTDPDMQNHELVIFENQFAGSGAAVIGPLLNAGLRRAPGRESMAAIVDLLHRWEPTLRHVLTDRLGWPDAKCKSFVLSDGSVIGDQNVKIRAGSFSADVAAMQSAGDLASWRTDVAALCIGNPLLMTAVSMSFAAPMLELLGFDGGGMHLRGRSSCGKSTIQAVAVSVWGNQKFRKSWNATANGLEGVAKNHNGLLLALDELGEISSNQLDKAVYTLANGQGKTRMQSNSALQSTSYWRVMILSSGEISIAEKIGENGKRCMEGHEVRLADIVADAGRFGAFDELHGDSDGDAFAKRLTQAVSGNHGTAGRAFVAALFGKSDRFEPTVLKAIERFLESASLLPGYSGGGQISRVATRFALIGIAGEIATKHNLTGWSAGAARAAALTTLQGWLDGGIGVKSAASRAATARARKFLLQHGAARFEDLEAGAGSISMSDRLGWQDANMFYIPSDTWRHVHGDHDSTQAARDLDACGFLMRGDGNNLMSKAPAAIPGRRRLYRLRKFILAMEPKTPMLVALQTDVLPPT